LESEIITYEKYTHDTPALKKMLADASHDQYLGDIVYQRKTDQMILIMDGTKLIGFAMPRLEHGFYRVGPIYVDSSQRGKGVATTFIKSFFESRNGRAYIDPTNIPSRKSFSAAGFVQTGKVYRKGDEQYLQYEKRVMKSITW
jgi:L-amino acid N-acyltransferase YncA